LREASGARRDGHQVHVLLFKRFNHLGAVVLTSLVTQNNGIVLSDAVFIIL